MNPQARLVHQNKLPRKLGYNENVLETPEIPEDPAYHPQTVSGFCSSTDVPLPVVRPQQRKQILHRASKPDFFLVD